MTIKKKQLMKITIESHFFILYTFFFYAFSPIILHQVRIIISLFAAFKDYNLHSFMQTSTCIYYEVSVRVDSKY